MSNIEKRARELLAAEYASRGSPRYADEIRDTELADFGDDDIAMAIRAIIAALTPPDGYVLVPMEPTMAMLIAAKESDKEYQLRNGLPDIVSVGPYDHYIAMLAARPEVP